MVIYKKMRGQTRAGYLNSLSHSDPKKFIEIMGLVKLESFKETEQAGSTFSLDGYEAVARESVKKLVPSLQKWLNDVLPFSMLTRYPVIGMDDRHELEVSLIKKILHS